MEKYINSRHESANLRKREYQRKHDLRIDDTKHRKDFLSNFLIMDGKITEYKYNKNDEEKLYQQLEKIKNKIKNTEKQHEEIVKKLTGKNLRKDKTNSLNKGVLSFENKCMKDRIKKKDKEKIEKFILTGKRRIERMCKKLGVELLYIVFHGDETSGHFHYMTSNYLITPQKDDFDFKGFPSMKSTSKLGKIISCNNNKGLGSDLQDFYGNEFKELGYKRGIKKQITQGRHQKLDTNIKLQHDEKWKRKYNEQRYKDEQILKQKLKEIQEIKENQKNINNEVLEENYQIKEELKKIKQEKQSKEVKINILEKQLEVEKLKLEIYEEYDMIRETITNNENLKNEKKKELHKLNLERKKNIKKRTNINQIINYNQDFNEKYQETLNKIRREELKKEELKQQKTESYINNQDYQYNTQKPTKNPLNDEEEEMSPNITFKPTWAK